MAHTMNLRAQEFISHFNAGATEVESQMASEEEWKGGFKASYGNVIKRARRVVGKSRVSFALLENLQECTVGKVKYLTPIWT